MYQVPTVQVDIPRPATAGRECSGPVTVRTTLSSIRGFLYLRDGGGRDNRAQIEEFLETSPTPGNIY